MRWWDNRVRFKVGLVAATSVALGIAAGGIVFWMGLLGTLLAAALIARSFRFSRSLPALTLSRVPEKEGHVYFGRGFEWTLDAAQQTIESGRVASEREQDLFLPESMLGQHGLVLGSTGTGKTRLLELLLVQAIARGDAVVVIDPKGDEGLLNRVRRLAGERFRLFSLPHPEQSVRYNPIGRYYDPREVADRVAALLPSTGDALPFRNFGWDIVNTVARELHGKQPMTFQNLKRCAIDHPIKPLADRPREHYLKMASALIPWLGKLATDQLSPRKGGLSWDEVDQKREVAYFSLGSLLGYETASAVAKIALLDLQSYVGARYAYTKGQGPIWLFVDELGDVVTGEFVQILNKSRGAGLRVVACGQTAADLEAALGSRARALQVLGNANTVIQFRAQSAPDALVFSEMAGERLVRMRSEGVSYEPALLNSGFENVDDFRAQFGDSFDWRESPLVPPWAIVQLPTFHFFGRWDGKVFRGRVPLLS